MKFPKVTARQAEVLDALADGLSYSEIGLRIGIRENSVREHLTRIRAKFDDPPTGPLLAVLWDRSKRKEGSDADEG